MQLNKLILDNNKENELIKCLKGKISQKNFCLHLTLVKIFCTSNKDAMKLMDNCFLMISETDNFLQLDVNLLKETLSRSNLLVTSEIEVYNAVGAWIKYNFLVRRNFAKRLLQTIRLPFLAENTLKRILTEKSCFRKNKDSALVVNKILKGNVDFIEISQASFLQQDTVVMIRLKFCILEVLEIEVRLVQLLMTKYCE